MLHGVLSVRTAIRIQAFQRPRSNVLQTKSHQHFWISSSCVLSFLGISLTISKYTLEFLIEASLYCLLKLSDISVYYFRICHDLSGLQLPEPQTRYQRVTPALVI